MEYLLFAFFGALIWRIRGHDFSDYYKKKKIGVPKWTIWADYILNKWTCAILMGLPFLDVSGAGDWQAWASPVIVALGARLGMAKGPINWTLDGSAGDKNAIWIGAVRSLGFAPLFLVLFFYQILYLGADSDAILWFLPVLSMGLIQYGTYFIPGLETTAQGEKTDFLRFWKGKSEVWDFGFGTLLLLCIERAV